MNKKILLSFTAVAAFAASARGPIEGADIKVVESADQQVVAAAQANEKLANAREAILDGEYTQAQTRGPVVSGDSTVHYLNLQPFYVGYSTSNYAYYNEIALVPAYSKLYFYNTSSSNISNFTWTYANVNDPQYNTSGTISGYGTTTSTSKHLILSNGLPSITRVAAPTLKAGNLVYNPADATYNSTNSTTYNSYIYSGGQLSTYSLAGSTDSGTFYVYPWSKFHLATDEDGSIALGAYSSVAINPNTTDTYATKFAQQTYSNATSASWTGIAQIIPSTTSAYYFDKVFVKAAAATAIEAGTTFSGTIYSYNSSTKEMSKLATMSYTFAEAKQQYYYIYPEYEVKTVDALTGLTSEGLIVPAGTQLLVALDGFGSAGIIPIFPEYDSDLTSHYNYQLLWFYSSDAGNGTVQRLVRGYLNDAKTKLGSAYNLMLGINPVFDYIYTATPNVTLPAEGGSATIDAETYVSYQSWDIEEDEDGVGEIDGWLKYSIAAGTDNWSPVITVSADKTTENRSATITIYGNYAAECVITVSQSLGEAGVEAVATEAIKVAKSGENFEVVVPETVSAVSVYNLNGQLVASQTLSAGANTVDASTLASGVYVLKFNNGTTVKAVK